MVAQRLLVNIVRATLAMQIMETPIASKNSTPPNVATILGVFGKKGVQLKSNLASGQVKVGRK